LATPNLVQSEILESIWGIKIIVISAYLAENTYQKYQLLKPFKACCIVKSNKLQETPTESLSRYAKSKTSGYQDLPDNPKSSWNG